MERPVIFVNQIIPYEEAGCYCGLASEPNTIANCIKLSFRMNDAKKLKVLAKASNKGASVCSNFWQFVIYAQLDNNLTTGRVIYFDLSNDMDLALDVCNRFIEEGKDEFVRNFMSVQEKYNEVEGICKLSVL